MTEIQYRATIIGLGYRIGTGKDAVADILCRNYGFAKLRYADALKEAVASIFGWPRSLLDDQEFKATEDPFWGLTPRTALQRVGTEAMRNNIRVDIWVKALEKRILNHIAVAPPGCGVRIVIPDVRFQNEVEAIKAWGGNTVNIVRPGNTWTPADTVNSEHASEHALKNYMGWDYTLVNDGTLAELPTKIEIMLSEVGLLCNMMQL